MKKDNLTIIIPCAGQGTRMGGLCEIIPKSLLPLSPVYSYDDVPNKSLMKHNLNIINETVGNLESSFDLVGNIKVVLVTGYRPDLFQEVIDIGYPNLEVTQVNIEEYKLVTNAYSMYVGLFNSIDGSHSIMIDGDTVILDKVKFEVLFNEILINLSNDYSGIVTTTKRTAPGEWLIDSDRSNVVSSLDTDYGHGDEMDHVTSGVTFFTRDDTDKLTNYLKANFTELEYWDIFYSRPSYLEESVFLEIMTRDVLSEVDTKDDYNEVLNEVGFQSKSVISSIYYLKDREG